MALPLQFDEHRNSIASDSSTTSVEVVTFGEGNPTMFDDPDIKAAVRTRHVGAVTAEPGCCFASQA
jgi:hypothetical protein